MRGIIISAAFGVLFGLADPAAAQNCANSVSNSYQCSDGSSLSPTWNGGYQSGTGQTWNRSPLDNGWNSNSGNTVRQNWTGSYQTGGGTTWSQSPLGGSLNSSGGRQCTTTLLGTTTCR